MKKSILIIAVVFGAFGTSCVSRKAVVEVSKFKVVNPEEMYAENPNMPGTFITSFDTLMVTRTSVYVNHGSKRNKITYKVECNHK